MSEAAGVFFAGVALGGVFIGLGVFAWAWDKGFAAGTSWARTLFGLDPQQ